MGSRRSESREPEEDALSEGSEGQMGYEQDGSEFARADPDVLLDVPVVKVEELNLDVEELKARVALRTRLADLLDIEVGVDLSLTNVSLETKGVEAEARLKARLENVDSMIHRTLASVDENPELIKDLTAMSEASSRGREDSGGGTPGGGPQLPSAGEPDVNATRAALNKAEELGVDLSGLQGSGSGGRITVKDVREAAG